MHIFNSYLQITQSETWGRVQYLPSHPGHSVDLMWGLTSCSSLPVLTNKYPVGPFVSSLRQFSDQRGRDGRLPMVNLWFKEYNTSLPLNRKYFLVLASNYFLVTQHREWKISRTPSVKNQYRILARFTVLICQV